MACGISVHVRPGDRMAGLLSGLFSRLATGLLTILLGGFFLPLLGALVAVFSFLGRENDTFSLCLQRWGL